MTLLRFSLAVLGSALFISCGNNAGTSEPRSEDKKDSIKSMAGSEAIVEDADGYAETDIFHTYTYCQQDIQLVFESGGYGESRQGCNSAWENMDWQLGNNQLSMQMYSDAIHLYLTQFDENTIRGYDQVNVNGSTYHITYTLRKRY